MFFENSNTPWVKPSFCGTILVAAVVAHLAHGAFDVRDFGAKGDGVAEDMVAVHGAIDAADVVSDTNRFSCGSGTVACLSPDSRRILAPYLASEAGRGECHDIAAVADIPLDNPQAAESFTVCHVGDVFCGASVSSVLSYASMIWRGRLRVYLDVNYETFGWRDWDPVSRKVVCEGLYRCRFGNTTRALSPSAIADYLALEGMRGFNPTRQRGDRCIVQTKPQWIGGAFHGFVTSSCSQPVLFRCSDGETLEFVGVVPEIAEYECQLAICGGTFYALMRGAKGDNFWISGDGGRTWKASGRLPDGRQRPQLAVFRSKVLVGYSVPDEKPSRVRNGRNNFHLLEGEGGDLSSYREVLHIRDPIGVVYPDLVEAAGQMHLLWSNSARFPDFVKWGAVQGKDQVLHAKLGL